MEELIGRKINRIFINEDKLKFDTDKGVLIYTVTGECCSTSLFYDFYGVKKLLDNGVVTDVKEIDLEPKDIVETKEDEYGSSVSRDKKSYDELISVYGFAITTVSEQFGEMTSVVSFRNYSNGYYGGSIKLHSENNDEEVLPEVFDDVVDTFKLE